jgi:hypothetical protein
MIDGFVSKKKKKKLHPLHLRYISFILRIITWPGPNESFILPLMGFGWERGLFLLALHENNPWQCDYQLKNFVFEEFERE